MINISDAFIIRNLHDDVLSKNNPDIENYLGQMYSSKQKVKDTTESNTSASYLNFILLIRRDGQFFTSSFDKSDDFSLISISQLFRSLAAIYHLRPPMASLSHSLYDMPGLAPLMNVLFQGRHDFQISFSNRDTSRNA